jgi:hypothetical protein
VTAGWVLAASDTGASLTYAFRNRSPVTALVTVPLIEP